MVLNGASVIDVGGESSKPGATYVNSKSEKIRILPLIQRLKKENINISIDTRKKEIMHTSLEEGVNIINDISGFRRKDNINTILHNYKKNKNPIYIIIMHMQGNPKNMQINPKYKFAPIDIFEYLKKKIDIFLDLGFPLENIAIDPGIGFGKNDLHNLQIIKWVSLFHGLGVPIMLGLSRKSIISRLSNNEEPKYRLPGSIALTMNAIKSGVQLIRTHDIKETSQAIKVELGLNF